MNPEKIYPKLRLNLLNYSWTDPLSIPTYPLKYKSPVSPQGDRYRAKAPRQKEFTLGSML